MSRSVQPQDYRQPAPPAPVTYRIEWTGGLKNYIPVKRGPYNDWADVDRYEAEAEAEAMSGKP